MDFISNKFTPTDELLINPHIGVMTQQRFNGDRYIYDSGWGYWDGDVASHLETEYKKFTGVLQNYNHPDTKIAYWRIYWKDIEPEKGKYIWDAFDRILEIANERGQTVMFRMMCYGSGEKQDIPGWFRQELIDLGINETWTNEEGGWNGTGEWWRTDANNPIYVEYFTSMVKSFAKRFDGDPRLDSVDLSFSGYWGEGFGTSKMTMDVIKTQCDAYLDNFKKTPLMPLCDFDDRTHGYIRLKGIEKGLKIGYRADSYGDMGYVGPKWNHMTHMYPQRISFLNNLVADRTMWQDGPVSFEAANTMKNWVSDGPGAEGPFSWDVEYIFNKGLEWHTSSFNNKSWEVPENYRAMLEEWLKRTGYRFSVASVDYYNELRLGDKLNIRSLWSNLGVAPLYHSGYSLAYRLVDSKNSENYVFYSDADLKEWMPSRDIVRLDTLWTAVGDIKVCDSFVLSDDITAGEYKLQISIVDTGRFADNKPAIKLANDFKNADGWYTVGCVNIKV